MNTPESLLEENNNTNTAVKSPIRLAASELDLANMKVSIITVTFNSERFLEDCIKSVQQQQYKNIEHIIIDGKSSDGTLDIIKKYENDVNLLYIVHNSPEFIEMEMECDFQDSVKK
jgi:cellulose synthase/poly-beta-1,6-N-acetylglucosamine synthase-like glycosyltransferase